MLKSNLLKQAVPVSEKTTIKELHFFDGHPGRFWPLFLQFASREACADRCILLKKTPSKWKQIYQWSTDKKRLTFSDAQLVSLSALADECIAESFGSAESPIPSCDKTIALNIDPSGKGSSHAAIFFSKVTSEEDEKEILQRLSLIADTPKIYERERSHQQKQKDRVVFANVLDMLLLINAENRFIAAAMTLVNETAARFSCVRVSLGWCHNSYIDLQVISHMERFEKKMDLVTCLEAAMEEAMDQDEEIIWPVVGSSDAVTRDHEMYAKKQQAGHLISLPLRLNEELAGVITCERDNTPFSEDDVRSLRILCDQVACRLIDLKLSERWLGTRIKDFVRKKLSQFLGIENTLLKLSVLIVSILILLSFIIKLPYRVEAPFILRSEDVRQVSVPFDSYIENVTVKIGQHVKAEEPLLLLDTRDLLLEESAALANQIRFLREVEKARVLNSLIEMKIAQARSDQAKAQLEMIRHRLQQSQVRSPIAGMIVEGDLEELQGAPVNKGDILFKVARHDNLFIEFKINEADIHELHKGQLGEIALVSQPHLKYRFKITQIDPIAVAGEAGNMFIARGKTLEDSENWWRPGMSGISKINVGSRRISWIITHRTIDFFEMLMWW